VYRWRYESRRSPKLKLIRKTKKIRSVEIVVSVLLQKFCEKLLPRTNFTKIGQSDAELWPKTIFKIAAVRRLEFLKILIFGHVTVIEFQLCICVQNRNWMNFRWNMAISRYSRWRISAILNFRGPIMGSSESPRMTSYSWSKETIALNCLVFEKIEFFYAFWRWTDRRTDGQPRNIKALSLSPATP